MNTVGYHWLYVIDASQRRSTIHVQSFEEVNVSSHRCGMIVSCLLCHLPVSQLVVGCLSRERLSRVSAISQPVGSGPGPLLHQPIVIYRASSIGFGVSVAYSPKALELI